MASEKNPRETNNDTKIAIYIGIIMLLAGAVIGALKSYGGNSADSVLFGLIYALTAGSAGYIFRIWIRLADIYKSIDSIRKDIHGIRDSAQEYARDTHIRNVIDGFDIIVKNTALRLIEHQKKSIAFDSSGFSFNTRDTALIITTQFWIELTELQKKLTAPIIVRITHSSSIDLWEGPDAEAYLVQQRKFIAAGGRVTRIIEGIAEKDKVIGIYDTTDDVAMKYRRVIKIMTDYGIDVKYIYDEYKYSDYDFTWVLLSENGPYSDVFMLWHAPKNSKIISSCEIKIKESVEVSTRWELLEEIYSRQNKNGQNKIN